MTTLDGIFSPRTPSDLRDKLEDDFKRFEGAAPASLDAQYAAFDFFVCAEHLPEWVKHSPGAPALPTDPDRELVSHIANGAKHFQVTHKRHTTVRNTSTQVGVAFQPGVFQSDAFQTMSTQQLVIELANGTIDPVLTVATRVLEY